jgi:hypothetical protein
MYVLPAENTDENKELKVAILSSSIIILFFLISACYLFIHVPIPKARPPLKSDAVIEEMIIDKDNVEIAKTGGSDGGGTENNAPINPVKHENPNTVVGNDFNAPANNGTNSAPNPFGTGGTGGGNGTGHGSLSGPGSGEGDGGEGIESGPGNGIHRVRLNDPILPKYKTDVDIKVHLKLIINSEGKVLSGNNIASKTTTTDQRIINGVISEVIRQVRYKQDKSAGTQYTYVTCIVRAQ